MYSENNNNKLVICQLAHYAPAFYGNFMASLFDLEEKIKQRNKNNKMIYVFFRNTLNCEWAKEMAQNNKNIYFLSKNKIKMFMELNKIMKHNNVNILHLHYKVPIISCILLKLIFPDIKITAHFHNMISEVIVKEWYINILRKIKGKLKVIRNVFLCNSVIDIFCGVSEAVFLDLIHCKMDKRKCCIVDNGIDFSRLDNNVEDGKEIYNLKNKKVLMVYGRDFYTKGVDIAINAVKDIVEKYNIVLMIVCQNKDFVLKQIKNMLDTIPEWIIIMPPQENIAFYFKMSDIYLTPSREEGFSYNLLEAIYCGTLTIRSDHPAMDRKIPGELVVRVNDVPALRQCIESALNLSDNDQQAALTVQKEYIVQRWNIDIWSDKIINMYLKVLNNEYPI